MNRELLRLVREVPESSLLHAMIQTGAKNRAIALIATTHLLPKILSTAKPKMYRFRALRGG